MRYDKAKIESAIAAATKSADSTNRTLFVFATHYGWKIDTNKPPFGQKHLIVKPHAAVEMVS